MHIANVSLKCQNCKDFMDRLLKQQIETLKSENSDLRALVQAYKKLQQLEIPRHPETPVLKEYQDTLCLITSLEDKLLTKKAEDTQNLANSISVRASK